MTEWLNDGLNYDSYLAQVPESLRDQIKPAFDSYSEQIKNKVQENVGSLSQFKEIAEVGWTPDHVNVGLNLLQTLNDNPEQIFQALVQENPDLLKLVQQQQPGLVTPPAPVNTPPGQTDFNVDPAIDGRIAQMEKVVELLAQGFQQNQQLTAQQQQAMQEQQELQQFEAELNKVAPEDKYPRPFILSYIAQGQTPQEAVKSFSDWQTSYAQQLRSNGAPLVAPAGGGGLPSEPVDTSKLSDRDRRDFITQYLEAANRAG
jgi:hypothetical protein